MSTDVDTPRPSLLGQFLALAAAAGLGASLILLWEYTSTGYRFCGEGEGCDLVRASRFAHLAGIPTPVFAVLYFALALVALGVSWRLVRRFFWLLALVGGLVGIALFLEQTLHIGAFCKYCLVGDTAQLFIAVLGLWRGKPAEPKGSRQWSVFAALVVLGMGVPLAYGLATSRPRSLIVPVVSQVAECIQREQSNAVITVVELVDFECPYCRAQHFSLARLLTDMSGQLGKPVRVVRKHMPLSSHKYAAGAARAAICAEAQGRGELMVDLLFSSEDLTPAAIETSASQLGMNVDAFRACVASHATTQRLAVDKACGVAAGADALPTFFIGEERFQGLQDDSALIAALRRHASQPAGAR